MSKSDTLESRLIRIESKLVRGFEELGVSLNAERNWLTVDNEQKIIYLSTIGNSIITVLSEMEKQGASHDGSEYKIMHKGDAIGKLVFNPN